MMEIPIVKPPFTGLGKKLESMMRKAIYDYKMLDGQETLAVALSGGKDSLTLLFLLNAIVGRGFPDIKIYAVHVSGKYSCGASIQLKYLQQICDQMGVELIVKESKQNFENLNCYSCSRERRGLIFQACQEKNISTVAFGHHLDDNAETILMNLFHKGEFAANLPKIKMLQYGITIIRPLIYIPEKKIQSFAKKYGFTQILCRCPIGQKSIRKKVKNYISDIEYEFPNVRKNISQAGLIYGSDKATKIRSK